MIIGIKVMYSCRLCGVLRAEVEVPERGEQEGVVEWVGETLARRIGNDHERRSPDCGATAIDEVWIPANAEGIGRPVKH